MLGRILFAEADYHLQQIVAQTLTTEQVETVCAGDGLAALCLLNETSPDVLIADIALPDKNGYELCRYVREEPEFRSMPVVLLDSHFDSINQSLASSVGADVYLSQPFEPGHLIEIVCKLLGSRQETSDEESAPAVIPASSQQMTLPKSYDPAEPETLHNADEMVMVGQSSEGETTTSTPEAGLPRPQRGRSLISWTVLAGAVIAALGLVILERTQVSSIPANGKQSSTSEPAQQAPVAIEEQKFQTLAGKEGPGNKSTPDNKSTVEASPSEANESLKSDSQAKGAEEVQTNQPGGFSRKTVEPNTEVRREASRPESPSVARRDGSPDAINNQHHAPVTRPRSVKSGRSNTMSSHLRRSGQEIKQAGKHIGSGAKHFGESGGDAAQWAGRKVGRGAKAIGRALKKIF
jgi:CheY-like chemotaxis protein